MHSLTATVIYRLNIAFLDNFFFLPLLKKEILPVFI